MTSNGLNDISMFTAVDNNTIDNNMYTQPVSVHANDSESNVSEPSRTENNVLYTPTTSNSSLPSVLPSNSNNSPNSQLPTSSASPVTSQSHVAIATTTVNHLPKMSSITNQLTTVHVNQNQILTRTRLQDLVKEIDPCEQLDEEVEDLLVQLVDDFVNSTVNTACIFAKHRNANTVEVKDVQLYLEKMYQMWIPGFGTEEMKPYKKPPNTEAHKQRLALIRKSLKKY